MDTTRSIITSLDGQVALEIQRPMLLVVEGTDAGRQHVLPEGPVVVGRGAEADVRLDDPTASRSHVRLVPDGRGWRVEDLGSKLGTEVDGEKVEAGALAPGGTLRVGRTLLRYELTTLVLRAPPPDEARLGRMVGGCDAMRKLFGLVRQVAPLDLPVMILGETGTGKEAVARGLHDEGTRKDGPYVVVDCTLLTGDHLRSELFGHEKGAYTGADDARAGAFERAHGGTLFLDEIGELPLELQPALLRVLQEGEIRPLGGDVTRKVDVRVVTATHRDPVEQLRAGRLREDLFYRLSAVQLDVPPLRERGDDVLLLARHFLPEGRDLSASAEEALRGHRWPGNVRELEQVLQVAAALSGTGPLEAEHLQLRDVAIVGTGAGGPAVAAAGPEPQTRAEFEETEIRQALKEARHNRAKAADILGIARSTLYARMKKYGIE